MTIVVCPKCFAQSNLFPPHGTENPCPLAVREHELALVERRVALELLNQQTRYWREKTRRLVSRRAQTETAPT